MLVVVETVFFRSVSQQLYRTADLHFQIRTTGIRHLDNINHPEFYIESVFDISWQNYIQQMSRQGTWCDSIIIQAVANAHNHVYLFISLSLMSTNRMVQ